MPANRNSAPGKTWTFPIDGARLRSLREERGLSREVLAWRAGLSLTTVATIEQQRQTRCRGRTLARLSAVLDEAPSALTPR